MVAFGSHAATHRYIRYADGEQELYDIQSDQGEWKNLAGTPESKPIIAKLKTSRPTTNVTAPRRGKRKTN